MESLRRSHISLISLFIEQLEPGKEYEIVGGTSAGALIMSSIILNQFEELETLFNSINNKDIYNVNPLRPNGEIRVLNSIFRTLFGYPSIGESKNLRKHIEKIFTKEDYNAIQEQQKILNGLDASGIEKSIEKKLKLI